MLDCTVRAARSARESVARQRRTRSSIGARNPCWKDRVHPVLERRPLVHDVEPEAGAFPFASHLRPGQPDFGYQIAVGELGRHSRVDPVGLARRKRRRAFVRHASAIRTSQRASWTWSCTNREPVIDSKRPRMVSSQPVFGESAGLSVSSLAGLKVTSICSSERRTSTSARWRRALLSATVGGCWSAIERLRGHRRRDATTLLSAASRVTLIAR